MNFSSITIWHDTMICSANRDNQCTSTRYRTAQKKRVQRQKQHDGAVLSMDGYLRENDEDVTQSAVGRGVRVALANQTSPADDQSTDYDQGL